MNFKTFCACLALVMYAGTVTAGGVISKGTRPSQNVSNSGKAKYKTLLDEVSDEESDHEEIDSDKTEKVSRWKNLEKRTGVDITNHSSNKKPSFGHNEKRKLSDETEETDVAQKNKRARLSNEFHNKHKKQRSNASSAYDLPTEPVGTKNFIPPSAPTEDSIDDLPPPPYDSTPEENPPAYGSWLTEDTDSSSDISDTGDSNVEIEPNSFAEQVEKLTGLKLKTTPKNKVKFISEILNVPEIILTTGVKDDDRVYLMYKPYDTRRKMRNTEQVEKANAKWKKYVNELEDIIPHTEYNALTIHKDKLLQTMNDADAYKFNTSEKAKIDRKRKALELLSK